MQNTLSLTTRLGYNMVQAMLCVFFLLPLSCKETVMDLQATAVTG